MFGMLDYRASKLYKILFFIPNVFVITFMVFVTPVIWYFIGLLVSNNPIWQTASSIVLFLIGGTIISIIIMWIQKTVFYGIFTMIIDVVPGKGRTEDQAKAIVYSGTHGVDLINLELDLLGASDALIERVTSYGAGAIFFKSRRIERMNAVRNYYQMNPDEKVSDYNISRLIDDIGLRKSPIEWLLDNFGFWGLAGFVVPMVIMSLLLIYRPDLF